jgi:hypothetical protein
MEYILDVSESKYLNHTSLSLELKGPNNSFDNRHNKESEILAMNFMQN